MDLDGHASGLAGDAAVIHDEFFNRELSWIDFDERVLALAERTDLALLERLKFAAIFAGNLDEFFQVRVAGLKDQVLAGVPSTSPDGLDPLGQLRAIQARIPALIDRLAAVLDQDLFPRLAAAGIEIRAWDGLDAGEREALGEVFEHEIFPVLTPLGTDESHPFPHVSDLSLNLAVLASESDGGERRFARVKVPEILPRFLEVPAGAGLVPLEQVIAAHLQRLFPGMDVDSHAAFRVTRNADLSIGEDDDAEDLLAAVEMELRRRRRGRAVRLEVESSMSREALEVLLRELELEEDDVYWVDGLLDVGGLWALLNLDRPDLKDDPWVPATQARLGIEAENPTGIFDAIRAGDLLVHHPYDSFGTSVEALLRAAAADPQVLAIKQTLYRTSGRGEVVDALVKAAEAGKQVAVLVEIKARFDEQANITWARVLEEAGVHVVYGVRGLKTHAKCLLVVRAEREGIRRYCHVGTGNYNAETARLYEDLGVLSADPMLGADLAELFNTLTGYGRRGQYRTILVAPGDLRTRLLELIKEQEALGPEGRIAMKLNGIDDGKIISALYAASRAGVVIDLVVRGICCVRPGVVDMSETIHVRSIVGRYLEHSRVFWFGPRDAPRSVLIGSADLRRRNLDHRIEVVVPVEDPNLLARLGEVLDANLSDDEHAWTLRADGMWDPPPRGGVDLYAILQTAARERANRADQAGPDAVVS